MAEGTAADRPEGADTIPSAGTAAPLAKLEIQPATGRERRFVLAALLLAILALSGVAAAGIVINPHGAFPTNHYPPITSQAVRVKTDLFLDHGAPDVLVLGSSRVMSLPGDPWLGAGNATWFNYGIPGATMTDLRLVWSHVVAEGGPPRHAVVFLDSFALRDASDGYPSAILRSQVAWRYTEEGVPLGHWAQETLRTLSVDYVLDDLAVLKAAYVTGYPESQTRYSPDGQRLSNPDGSTAEQPPADLEAAVAAQWESVVRRVFVEPLQPRDSQEALFAHLVADMRKAGTTVDIILPPFSDLLLERLEGNEVFAEFQEAANELALRQCQPGVRVFDYTAITAFGGDAGHFADGYHLTLENARRVAAAAAAGEGDSCPANS